MPPSPPRAEGNADTLAEPPHDAPDRRGRGLLILGLSALAHVGALVGAAGMSPPALPAPRLVEVMTFETVPSPTGAAVEWRSEGGRRSARIRPDPAIYARESGARP